MPNGQEIFIAHRIPGRVRLSVESIRRDPARAEGLARAVRAVPCVIDARASADAASLVIEHDAHVALEDLLILLACVPELSVCATRGIAGLSRPPPARGAPSAAHPERTAGLLLRTAARINEAAREVVLPHADLKLLLPGALFSYGVYHVLSGRPTTRLHWITLVKYGFDLFAILNQRAIRSFMEAPPAAGSAPLDGGAAP